MNRSRLVHFTLTILLTAGITVLNSLLPGAESAPSAASLRITELRCEAGIEPLNVGTTQPRLSWILVSGRRGARQSAFEIQAASGREKLLAGEADLWNSGRVGSDQSVLVPWGGVPLRSGQRVFWRVRVWDERGDVSPWSQPATWTMALLRPEEWKARWIGSGVPLLDPVHPLAEASWIWYPEEGFEPGTAGSVAPGTRRWFRRRFRLPGRRIESAELILAADNSAEVSVNGQAAGRNADHYRADRLPVGLLLRAGEENRIEIEAANGGSVPGPAALLGRLTVLFADGTSVSVVTDGQWETRRDAEGDAWREAHVFGRHGIEPWREVTVPGTHRPLPVFRREFRVARPVRRALVHVAGLGQHDLWLDGRRVGDALLDPPWSEYEKTCYYATHDVTEALRAPGAHAFGVLLGKGWYHNKENRRVHGRVFEREPRLILQAHLEYEDGTSETVVTGPEWKWTEGPLLHDAILGGVDYDARRLPEGWAAPGFDDSGWKAAQVQPEPGGVLAPAISPSLRAFERFEPRSIDEVEPGVFVYDFGQNASAAPELRVSGPAGKTIRLRYAEQRHGSTGTANDGKGRIDPAGIGQPAWIDYTLRGGDEEIWMPRTFYTGYQYLELTGGVPEGHPNPDGLPVVHGLRSVHVRAALESVGEFQCSKPLFNEIDRMIDWAVRSNLSHVLTDCPHREKLGWLEVAYLMWPSIAFRYDLSAFGPKVARDIRDGQGADGIIYTVAPNYMNFRDGFLYTPEWGAAGVYVPWFTWRWFGDRRTLEENFDCMRRFVDYMYATSTDLVPKAGLGDWYDYGHGKPLGPSRFTPPELTAMATFRDCALIVSRAAHVLGREAEKARYEKLAGEIAAAFNRKYFNGADQYENRGSPQTANAMALCSGIVDSRHTSAVVERIVADLEKRGWQQTSGDVGHVYLIRALAEAGRSDVLFRVADRTSLGSYGHLVRNGWTSLPEAWNAHRASSMNHCMLGHIQEWFHQYVAGIRPDDTVSGFHRFVVKPEPVGDLTWAAARHRSPYGEIATRWERADGRLTLDVTVPVNTAALVHVPAADGDRVTEGGRPAEEVEGVEFIRREKSWAVYQVGAGRYRFEAAGR